MTIDGTLDTLYEERLDHRSFFAAQTVIVDFFGSSKCRRRAMQMWHTLLIFRLDSRATL